MAFRSLDEILDYDEKFVKSLGNKEVSPQLVVGKGKAIFVFVIVAGREAIRSTMDVVAHSKPDWVSFMCSSFMGTQQGMNDYKHGELEEKFKNGDPNVREVVIVQAYSKKGKKMRVLDQNTHERIHDVNEFSGYLAFDDLKKIFKK